ncbi:helix-turn-helix transcriptional regulator [Aerococcus viridans]|uniref:helix-turn-helix transcriptional regulator n=1 Tax=Aerococcus viridans TaxID=1377 RepID=UPI003AA7E450
MTDKTVKEVAEMLGVTKQTVQYHLKSLPTNYTTKSDKNIIYIRPLGQKALSDKIDKRKQFSVDKETVKPDKEPTKETVGNDKEIAHYKEQIKEKDQQISQLLESQKQLQKLIENQQVLTLQANQKIEKLELTFKDNKDEMDITSKNNKRKWTDFFKSKK